MKSAGADGNGFAAQPQHKQEVTMSVLSDSKQIIAAAIHAALPDTAVEQALEKLPEYGGRLILIAAGKAAWQMASAAWRRLGNRISGGVVITKYHHAQGSIGRLSIFEAGHPVPDENSYRATQAAMDAVTGLTESDLVLFLLSGGGSALFEKPLIPPEELAEVTRQMLACGADITEINTLRKRFSAVKGGKFAQLCAPAQVFSIVLSDILGDPLDAIASGPAYPDPTTAAQAQAVAEKYQLTLSSNAKARLAEETPKKLDNVSSVVTGSVRQLCASASQTAAALGYKPIVLSASVCCEAREAGSFLASIAQYHQDSQESLAFILGGETVVHLTGDGLGGRNQELALGAARGIAGMHDTLIFSIGSDGTDGPTDAAGGWADGETINRLTQKGLCLDDVLRRNDAYSALKAIDGLIITGPTGTNVNDLTVLLLKRGG